jgi:hypothetical protein
MNYEFGIMNCELQAIIPLAGVAIDLNPEFLDVGSSFRGEI